MKYSLHIGNNEDSRGSLEIIFYFLINILLTLKTKRIQLVENWGDESVPVTCPRSMID